MDPLGIAAVLLGGTLLGNALGWGAFLVLFCGEVLVPATLLDGTGLILPSWPSRVFPCLSVACSRTC
jgi:hypothetical protein